MNRSLNILKTTVSGLLLAACSLFYSNAYAQWCTGDDYTCWGTAMARQQNEDIVNRGRNNGSGSAPVYVPTKPSKYGAVAENSKTGAVGHSNMQSSKSAAKKAALLQCGERGCKVISAYANTCMAYATGSNGFGFLRNEQTLKAAEETALLACQSKDSNCSIFISECSLP